METWHWARLRQRLQLARQLAQLLLRRLQVDVLVLQLLRQASDLAAEPLFVLCDRALGRQVCQLLRVLGTLLQDRDSTSVWQT